MPKAKKEKPMPDVCVGETWCEADTRGDVTAFRVVYVTDTHVDIQRGAGKVRTVKRARFNGSKSGYRRVP